MTLEAPHLDDRTYEDLVAELKQLVPRYTPEWTDLNEPDPGVALIELQAWLVEQLLYRLNRVPDRHYAKFLDLLRIRLEPARPARTELAFTLARDDVEGTLVPKGTQVAASVPGSEPVVFETDEAFFALGATLSQVVAFENPGHANQTTANAQPNQTFRPFGSLARQGAALMLGLSSPADFPDEDFDVAVVLAPPEQERSVHCDLDVFALPVPADLAWEYWDGGDWAALTIYKDGTRSFTQDGHVYLSGPGTRAQRDQLAGIAEDLFWIRCRVTGGGYERPPEVQYVAINTVQATQAVTVEDEVLGGSNGEPDQSFELANFPVVVRPEPETVTRGDGTTAQVTSLRLEVDEGLGFEVWEEVEDFDRSGPTDRHYTLDLSEGRVTFGDGDRGRIPLANRDNPTANVVARSYRYGGGSAGNVPAATITELLTFVEHAGAVTNPRAAEGGTAAETVTEARRRAASVLKSRNRAVTAEDYEYLATVTPGAAVRRAKAMARTHPDFDVPVPGAVTVVVVPDVDADVVRPMPTEATLQAVCAHLNSHRVLTAEVYTVAPTYHRVEVEARLVALPSADLAEVTRNVTEALDEFLHPLTGGRDGTGWEFGRDVHFSEVYRRILEADEGVDRVEERGLVLHLDGERQREGEDIVIPEGVLVYSDGHDVKVSYSRAAP